MSNKNIDLLIKIGVGIALAAVAIGFLYCAVYLGKQLSYAFFYESLVQDTVKELVKAGALK